MPPITGQQKFANRGGRVEEVQFLNTAFRESIFRGRCLQRPHLEAFGTTGGGFPDAFFIGDNKAARDTSVIILGAFARADKYIN